MRTYSGFVRKAAEILKRGGVGIVPTDTIYGISGSAFSPKAVARIYRLRKRSRKKPMIILIASIADLKKFGITLNPNGYALLTKLWPGKVSVVLPCRGKKFSYLHRGTSSLAFRLPAYPALRRFLKRTGPLVSASANFEGEPPARTAAQAEKYFGRSAGFYIDVGRRDSLPSTLIAISGGKVKILRQGAARIGGRLAGSGR